MLKETDIEKRLVSEVEKRGGECLKYFNPAKIGYPDRICLLPGGVLFWVEVKAPTKIPRNIQLIRMDRLVSLGQKVHVVDTFDAVDRLMKIYDNP
jgi:hypothetical protein